MHREWQCSFIGAERQKFRRRRVQDFLSVSEEVTSYANLVGSGRVTSINKLRSAVLAAPH